MQGIHWYLVVVDWCMWSLSLLFSAGTETDFWTSHDGEHKSPHYFHDNSTSTSGTQVSFSISNFDSFSFYNKQIWRYTIFSITSKFEYHLPFGRALLRDHCPSYLPLYFEKESLDHHLGVVGTGSVRRQQVSLRSVFELCIWWLYSITNLLESVKSSVPGLGVELIVLANFERKPVKEPHFIYN